MLSNFESAAATYDPALLIVPGLTAVAAGLIIWLAGLRISKAVAVLFGSAAGAVAGLILFKDNALPAIFLGAAIGAIISLVFDKAVIILVGSVVLSTLCLFWLASYFLDRVNLANSPGSTSVLNQQQTLDFISTQAHWLYARAADLLNSIPVLIWPVAVVLLIMLLVFGALFVRMLAAISCSSIGTAFIFAGMIWLLLYKGSAPLSRIYASRTYYFAVFAVMVVFGTLVQLALCGPRPKKIEPVADTQTPSAKQFRGDV